jgi:predicted nucleotidyltransferase
MSAATLASPRLRPSAALAPCRQQVRDIVARHKGANPRVFGSVARGEDTEQSDLDVLIDHRPGSVMSLFDLSAIRSEIEDLLGVTVQVMTPASLAAKIRIEAEREACAV